MKEATKRRIAKKKSVVRDILANYKGKPVSLREAVKAVHEMRRERHLAESKSGH